MGRTNTLARAFNDFWQRILDTNEDLYSKISVTDLVNLKRSISNVNNLITLEITKKFVNFLKEEKIIQDDQYAIMLENIEATSANANGYDIEYPLKKGGSDSKSISDKEKRIVAEVKCCIPVENNRYGAAQEESILSDIEHLCHKKSKSKMTAEEFSASLKFLVLLNYDKVKDAVEKIIDKAVRKGNNVCMYTSSKKLITECIHIVIIDK